MSTADRRVWLLTGTTALAFALLVPVSAALGVNYDYTSVTVALGGALLGMSGGVLGSFAVLRRESLMGDALAHAALPGVALAFLVAGREMGGLLIGAGLTSWLGVALIQHITRTTHIKQDAAMGIVLAAFFGIGVALLAFIQDRADASQAGLDKFIFGQAASIVSRDVLLVSVIGLAAFAVVALFWKGFKVITFDPEFARANGINVSFLNMLLSTLIVVAIVLGLQLAGVVLMVGLLIAPAVAARQWTRHLGQMVALAGVFGTFSGATGAIISGMAQGLPTGPLIVVVASALVLISIAFAPGRGVLWTWWRDRRDRVLSERVAR
jgi:manganese/zinc/iron transport system permease protein